MSCYPALNQFNRPPIVVTDNDVLCGRGVNIAAHAGNERFRTLVTTRADANYCEGYSAFIISLPLIHLDDFSNERDEVRYHVD
jgi:hypothetical protein